MQVSVDYIIHRNMRSIDKIRERMITIELTIFYLALNRPFEFESKLITIIPCVSSDIDQILYLMPNIF